MASLLVTGGAGSLERLSAPGGEPRRLCVQGDIGPRAQWSTHA